MSSAGSLLWYHGLEADRFPGPALGSLLATVESYSIFSPLKPKHSSLQCEDMICICQNGHELEQMS